MATRAGVATVVVAASILLGGCRGHIRSVDFGGNPPQIEGLGGCSPNGGVRLDANLGQNGPLYKLAVGERRTFPATVDSMTSGCPEPGRAITRIEWFGRNEDPKARKVRIHMLNCGACTLLFEDRPPTAIDKQIKGAARVNAGMRVAFEVEALAPGSVEFDVSACTDDSCIFAVWDRVFLEIE